MTVFCYAYMHTLHTCIHTYIHTYIYSTGQGKLMTVFCHALEDYLQEARRQLLTLHTAVQSRREQAKEHTTQTGRNNFTVCVRFWVLCACMYVCIHVYYIQVYVRGLCVCVYIYIYIYIYYVCVCIYIYICIHTYIYIHTYCIQPSSLAMIRRKTNVCISYIHKTMSYCTPVTTYTHTQTHIHTGQQRSMSATRTAHEREHQLFRHIARTIHAYKYTYIHTCMHAGQQLSMSATRTAHKREHQLSRHIAGIIHAYKENQGFA
jgi:hypothetical protein